MEADIERRMANIGKWLKTDGEILLSKIGVKKGQTVLDFGCGRGNYTIPAAKIVGEEGKVYALDKDEAVLSRVLPKAEISGLKNIVIMKSTVELKINLEDTSIDVVLLYDVLHSRSFTIVTEEEKLLKEVHRILKPEGFLSVYPMHRDLKEIIPEIEGEGFHLDGEYHETLLAFSGDWDKGEILNFRKK